MRAMRLGPECRYCGCPSTVVIREPDGHEWFASGVAHCTECNKVFSFEADKNEEHAEIAGLPQSEGGAVIFYPVRCPDCRSTDVPVQHTSGRVRYHKCRGCLQNFKSVEK